HKVRCSFYTYVHTWWQHYPSITSRVNLRCTTRILPMNCVNRVFYHKLSETTLFKANVFDNKFEVNARTIQFLQRQM
ncbi:hypothetical protein E2986_12846, partial [Frieseomelitta varia]